MAARPERLGTASTTALAVVLILAALAFGGVHEWASALLETAVFALALLWALGGRREARTPRAVLLSAAGLATYLVAQVMPLPPALVGMLSPGTNRIYEHTVDALPPSPPVTAEAPEVASLASRVRDEAAWAPPGWRTISLHPFATRAELLRYAAAALMLWLAATLPRPAFLARAAFGTGAGVAALALIQFFTWNGRVLWFFEPRDVKTLVDYPRMLGPFVNPDHMAIFLAMIAPVGVGLLVTPRRQGPAIFGRTSTAIALTLVLAALLGSASRAGIVAAATGVAVVWWGWTSNRERALRRGRRRRRRAQRLERVIRRAGPILVAAAIVLAAFTVAGPDVRATLDERLRDTASAVSGEDWRLLLWRQSLPMVRDFPLFGVGAGNWNEVFRQYQRYPVVGRRPNHAHNDYLEWVAEVGCLGALLTIGVVVALVMWARANESIPRGWRWGLLGSAAAVAVHEIFDFGLRVPANAFLLAVLLGLLCNRRWTASPDGAGTGRGVRIAGAVLVPLVPLLIAGSVWQLIELAEHGRARSGSLQPYVSPGGAHTWYEIARSVQVAAPQERGLVESALRRAVDLRPAWPSSFWTLSQTTGDPAVERAALEAAIFLDPTRPSFRAAYAIVLDRLERHAEALGQIEEGAYRSPSLATHPYLADGDRRPAPAVLAAVARGFERAIAERPGDTTVIVEAALFHERFDRSAAAAALWQQAAEASDGWRAFGVQAGEALARAGDLTAAERVLGQAIAAAPERYEGYLALATSVLRPQDRWEDAARMLELGASRALDPVPLHEALHRLWTERGETQRALQALAQAASASPRYANAHFALGWAYLDAGDAHRAKVALDRAIAIDGARAGFHHAKGLACEQLYDFACARDEFARALELEPSNPSYAERAARIRDAFDAVRKSPD